MKLYCGVTTCNGWTISNVPTHPVHPQFIKLLLVTLLLIVYILLLFYSSGRSSLGRSRVIAEPVFFLDISKFQHSLLLHTRTTLLNAINSKLATCKPHNSHNNLSPISTHPLRTNTATSNKVNQHNPTTTPCLRDTITSNIYNLSILQPLLSLLHPPIHTWQQQEQRIQARAQSDTNTPLLTTPPLQSNLLR